MNNPLAERDLCLVWMGGKERRAVVLAIDPGGYYVIAVTSTFRAHYEHVEVSERSTEGKALRLSNTSYFYRSNAIKVPLDFARKVDGRCPPGLHKKLLELVSK
jgi:hypothetical protein